MLWFSPSHRKDSEKVSIFENKNRIAQAFNSWVTIDLKKDTNLFEISLSIENSQIYKTLARNRFVK